MRAELQVDLEDPLSAGVDRLQEQIDQSVEVFFVGDRWGTRRVARALVQKHQLDVRSEPQLPPATLPESTDRHPAGPPRGEPWRTELSPEFRLAAAERGLDRDLRDVRQFVREAGKRILVPQDVPHVDAQHLAVLEGIQHLPLGLQRLGGLQLRIQFASQLVDRPGLLPHRRIGDDGQHAAQLLSQQLLPHEVAHPQQTRQRPQDLRAIQRSHLLRPVGPLEQLHQQLSKVQQRCLGVRRLRQQVRKVLDEDHRRPQLIQPPGIGDLATGCIGHVQSVTGQMSDRANLHALNLNAAQRQGVGEFVEESQRVLAGDAEDRGLAVGVVVELDLQREQGRDDIRFELDEAHHSPGQPTLNRGPGLGVPVVGQADQFRFIL